MNGSYITKTYNEFRGFYERREINLVYNARAPVPTPCTNDGVYICIIDE